MSTPDEPQVSLDLTGDDHALVDQVQYWVAYQCYRQLPDGEWHAGKPLGAGDDLLSAALACAGHAKRNFDIPRLDFVDGGGAFGLKSYQAAIPVQTDSVEVYHGLNAYVYERNARSEIRYVVEGF